MRPKEEWKAIPGYGGKYEASIWGEVRRIYGKAPPREMTAYEKQHQKGSRKLVVKLTRDGEPSREASLAQVIYTTFKGRIPAGWVIVHKNGIFRDNMINNLELITKKEVGIRYGKMANDRQCVAKINADGEIVEVYNSAREAGRKNFMSYQTILDRCNGKVKRGPAPDGYEYIWEDSKVSRQRAMKRMERKGKI